MLGIQFIHMKTCITLLKLWIGMAMIFGYFEKAFAQDISLVATVDQNVLPLNDRLQFTLTVNGTQDTPIPSFPSIDGFTLLYGPKISAQTRVINGNNSVSKGYTYVLQPAVKGKFTIGTSTVEYKGKVYSSKPITIEVVDKKPQPEEQFLGLKKHASQLPTIKQIYEEHGIQKEVDISLPSGSRAEIKMGSKGRVYTIDEYDSTECPIADIEVTRIIPDGIARATRTKGSNSIKIKIGDIVKFEPLTLPGDALEISEKDRRNAEAYRNRGNTYLDSGDYDRAIVEYDKAIELDPKNAVAYYSRGNAYNRKGEYDRAIADCSKAIEFDPKFAVAFCERGNAYDRKGEYDRAIADCTKAIELDPKFAVAYGNRGYAYNKKGEYDRAISDCTRAIELDIKHVAAYVNRGYFYYLKGEYNYAWADINKAKSLGYEVDPEFLDALRKAVDSRHNSSKYGINQADMEIAKKIYKDTCELCHGSDGKGSKAGKQFGVPDFTSPYYQDMRTDAQMKESMFNGTKNPNYVKLSDLGVDVSRVELLVKLVREFNGR